MLGKQKEQVEIGQKDIIMGSIIGKQELQEEGVYSEKRRGDESLEETDLRMQEGSGRKGYAGGGLEAPERRGRLGRAELRMSRGTGKEEYKGRESRRTGKAWEAGGGWEGREAPEAGKAAT